MRNEVVLVSLCIYVLGEQRGSSNALRTINEYFHLHFPPDNEDEDTALGIKDICVISLLLTC